MSSLHPGLGRIVFYTGRPDDNPTFGVLGTLVASSNVSEKTVYDLVKSVFGNFDTFKEPASGGAKRYYRKRGGSEAPLDVVATA